MQASDSDVAPYGWQPDRHTTTKDAGFEQSSVSATALLLLCCLLFAGSSRDQGIDGLSQLLGGGLGLPGSSGQSNSPVTVQLNAAPYTGVFSGKETTGSETKSLDAKLACYPAHDPAFDQTDTFVCYDAQ